MTLKTNRNTLIAAATFATVLAFPTFADEAWNLVGGGEVYYEIDIGTTAVFRRDADDVTIRYYIPGLAVQLDSRGTHSGYWIDNAGAGGCDAQLYDGNGFGSNSWGSMTLTFDADRFPSGWTAILGTCFDGQTYQIRADVPQ